MADEAPRPANPNVEEDNDGRNLVDRSSLAAREGDVITPTRWGIKLSTLGSRKL